jgi:acyl-CoA synthetase (AMP-forming)/AMP-acid ligase II
MTMAEAFRQVASGHPRREALVCGEVRATYGQVADRVTALACGLGRLGIGKGYKVAVALFPGPEFVYLFFALAELGAVMVPINPQLRHGRLSHLLRDSEPVAMVTSGWLGMAEDRQMIEDTRPEVPSLRHVILAEGGMESDLRLADLMSTEGFPESRPEQSRRVVEGSVSSSRPPDVAPDDLLALLYTSGTTGVPKGTMHNHRSLMTPVIASLKLREMWIKRPSLKTVERLAKVLPRYGERLLRAAGRPQSFLSTVGFHTITGLEVMLQGLLMGDKLVIMPRFHPVETLQLIEKERVTIMVAVPMALSILMRMRDLDRYDLSSLLICGTGSAPCPADLACQIQKRFGCAIHIGFGTTELAGGIAATSLEDSEDLQAETVGQAMPGMEIKIVDDQWRELPPGQVGELACRGESVMMGYWRAPDRTAEVVDGEGWYYTGDLATMDEQGYVRIVGRKRDMIIRGGQNIYPAEIENYLVTHGQIREAAVVGVPAPIGGERAWAFVILEEGAEMTVREVLDYCRMDLDAYKIPDRVRFVKDFPRAASGKPQKFKLHEMALREGQAGEQSNRS